MNQSEHTIERSRCNYLSGLTLTASIFGLLLLAVSSYAQNLPAVETETVRTKKELSIAQIKKAPDTTATEE
jgi:hypothetical protein